MKHIESLMWLYFFLTAREPSVAVFFNVIKAINDFSLCLSECNSALRSAPQWLEVETTTCLKLTVKKKQRRKKRKKMTIHQRSQLFRWLYFGFRVGNAVILF